MAAALTLVVVGGLSLINALTSQSPGPAPSLGPSTAGQGTAEPSASVDPLAPPLEITVVGSPTTVFVRGSGAGGEVLYQGVLGTGETLQYDQVPMDVVVDNSASVQVRIYGRLQRDRNGGRGQWIVRSKTTSPSAS